MLKLINQLISIPSTKDNPQDLKHILEVANKELKGLKSKKFTKNNVDSLLFYNTPQLPKKFKVILNAHLDVVPGKPEQYKPIVKGDKLWGRGASDMKAAAAVEILVFKKLAKKVNYPLGLQLVTDEEIGGFNGAKYQSEQGIKTDFILAGEPTDFGVNHESKGIIWAKISATGISAHGSHPWEGQNAIWKMKHFLDILEASFPERHKEVWQTTINLARIETQNVTTNKVPDDCSVYLDIRFTPKDKAVILTSLKRLIPKDMKLELLNHEPVQFTAKNNPFLNSLRQVTRQVAGKLPPLVVKHGGSDVRHYTSRGMAGCTFGPIGEGLHTDREWVSLKSLDKFNQILTAWLLSLNK